MKGLHCISREVKGLYCISREVKGLHCISREVKGLHCISRGWVKGLQEGGGGGGNERLEHFRENFHQQCCISRSSSLPTPFHDVITNYAMMSSPIRLGCHHQLGHFLA